MSRAFTILFVVILWTVLTLMNGHGESISGFQLTGPLEASFLPMSFDVGTKFTIMATDPSLYRMLKEMEGKKVVIRVEVKK